MMTDTRELTDEYDVIIVGGGIVGAASLFALSCYTNIKKIALFEKESDLGLVKHGEVFLLRGKGGIRPQVVNINKKELEFGEAEIVGNNIIFSITPSPGASVSLGYAKNIAEKVVNFLGKDIIYFNEAGFNKELNKNL